MAHSRRKFLQGTAGVALGSIAAPWVKAQTPTLSISVDDHSPLFAIKELAENDLEINLNLLAGTYSDRLQQTALGADQCQLIEFRSNNTNSLWRSRGIRPIEVDRLDHWQELTSTLGVIEHLSDEDKSSPIGEVPRQSLYVQKNAQLGADETRLASYVPYGLSNETLSYNPDLIPETLLQSSSWSWMLASELQGRVALSNSPGVGYYDLALAMNSVSPGSIANLSSPTLLELKTFNQRILALAAKGQFSAVWGKPQDILESLASGETIVANFLAQDIPAIRGRGLNLQQANLKEGFRGWINGLYLRNSAVGDYDQAIAYDFLNWLMSGSPGAVISRMGYTTTTPELTKQYMSANDWGYWYDGKATEETIFDPSGYPVAKTGESRVGGSYQDRFGRIGVWTNGSLPHMDVILQSWGRLVALI